MKLASIPSFLSTCNIHPDKFPFFFSHQFSTFLKDHEKKELIVIHDEKGNSIICKKWQNKFLTIVQPMFPPLSREGLRLDEDSELRFIDDFISFSRTSKLCERITQPENFAIFKKAPKGSTFTPFGTYYIDLQKNTLEQLYRNIHTKHRNVIRNAKKKGVLVKYGPEVIDDFYNLYEQTMARSNLHCQSLFYFKEFYTKMPQNVICGVVYYNDQPLGGVFIPYTQCAAFYLYGASAEKIEITGAINYLHWRVIELLKQKGVKRYDFVGARLSDVSGTKLKGIQQFKKRFGAELEEGYLWKMDLDRFACFVFDLLIHLKHKANKLTPPLDIIEEELHKYNLQQSRNIPSLNKKIKNKLLSERQKLDKKLRTFKKTTNKEKLVKHLANAGINKGDTLLVHSSLSKIGNVRGGSKTVIYALLEQIGNEGNLIMPSYSYIHSMENTAREADYLFDPSSSPSKVGIITEEFRKWPGTKRSIHPTHSVSAIGPQAGFITEGHLKANTNFGINTPFHRIRELKGKIVGLGINIGPVTIYHSIEDFYPDLFKGVYLSEQAPIKVLVEGNQILKKVSIHNPAFHSDRIDKNKKIEQWFRNYFKGKGILHESKFGMDTIWWMDIQQLFDELLVLRKKKISIYQVPFNERK